jgi:hypothetical protein
MNPRQTALHVKDKIVESTAVPDSIFAVDYSHSINSGTVQPHRRRKGAIAGALSVNMRIHP